jgi:MFS family permease
MTILAFARSIPSIVIATFFMGWLAEMYRPAVMALVTDVVPAEKRTIAFGHLYWVINLGFGLAAAIGGLASSASFTALFILDAATMGIYGLIVLAKVPETRPAESERHEGSPLAGLGDVVRDGTFMLYLVLMMGMAVTLWQSGTALPLDLKANGISSTTFGALIAINGGLIVIVQPTMTRWLADKPRGLVLAMSSWMFAIGFGLYAFVDRWWGYAIGIVIWTLGEIANLPTSNTVVADLAPPALRGRYQGLFAMTFGAASVIAPILGGAMLEGPGADVLWIGIAGLMTMVGLGHLALGPRLTRTGR